MCWLVVVEHEVDGVRGRADEDNLKDGVVEIIGIVKCPEQVNVSCYIDNQIQKLRFKGDARRALGNNR